MDQRRPRCFVVQENPSADYGDAERYGELVIVSYHEFRPMANSMANDEIIATFKEKLGTFTKDDYLILTGNPTIIGFAFTLAMSKLGPTEGLNILQWDRMRNQYRPYTFEYKL